MGLQLPHPRLDIGVMGLQIAFERLIVDCNSTKFNKAQPYFSCVKADLSIIHPYPV